METHHRIGEVARLLGITTKTIRHYEKIGLLAEAPRTTSSYRLYSAQDLVQIVRIRRLQRLGLSLTLIHRIFSEPSSPTLLRQALENIGKEVDEEIQHLHMRRDRITALLSQTAVDIDQPETVPALLVQAQSHIPALDPPATATMWEQDQRLLGMLESLALPDGYHQQMQAMTEHVVRDPELYHRLFLIAEQLAALVDLPVESPLVEQLVVRAQAEGWLKQLQDLAPTSVYIGKEGELVNEILLSILSPAQQRFLNLLGQGEDSI